MSRCDTVVTTRDGIVHRCSFESAKGSTSCYLHGKYWAGLCEPVSNYGENGKENREDEVVMIEKIDKSKSIQYAPVSVFGN